MGSQVSVDNVHVVVVGGGFGGTAAAQQLKSRGIPFTLIDLRDAFHHNVAALRASVQSGFAQQTFIPYFKTFGENFLQGRVVRVDPVSQTVALDGGKEVHYSHLILCTGTDGPFPGKYNMVASYQTAIQKYEDIVKEVQAAGSVLVVGGGSTGVEMAAEIKTEYPDKKVILIHSHVGLADPELLPSVRQQAKEVLLEKGVELLLGQKVSNLSVLELNVTNKNMVIMTDKDTEITADLVICCTGMKINSDAYSSTLNGCLAENGSLKVNVHLQVEGYDNVYAAGDCANVNEPKMAYHAGLHAGVAVTNITNSLMGKPLESYHPGSVTMLLAMGHNDGVGQFNGLRLPRCLVTQGKSKNLLLWKSWKEMGQKAP
ncbi:ferroptosis suppressor protein 1 [Salvelinus sp. IW2-2015]|uniref:ferroptosis suppressor protein 1 n=1 Tax=Salvelinus sp. IW2-2015 TaxID=2691554 RepID=UPI000CEAB0D5|nr:apoptosis-inducing factor 2 [Salvelinus alpinus]XP_024002491.1 apoptosis-inducing factor 2 [Salvelinus alpinus]